MKKAIAGLLILIVIVSGACKKQNDSQPPRKFLFQLYTNKDFSTNEAKISFSVFIRSRNITLFDSALAPMKIKDIPDALHKISIEKSVWGHNYEDLAAGFRYKIEEVGESWYIDTSSARNPFKIIDYAFQ